MEVQTLGIEMRKTVFNLVELSSQVLSEPSKMYCFCTASLPIRAIAAISEAVIGAKGQPMRLLFFQVFVAKSKWIRVGGWAPGECSSPT